LITLAIAEGHTQISSHPYGILQGVVDDTEFIKGSWGAAIADDLAPAEGDIVIEGKCIAAHRPPPPLHPQPVVSRARTARLTPDAGAKAARRTAQVSQTIDSRR